MLPTLLLGTALPAAANPVVAVALVTYPLFLLGLLPIIAVEAWVLRRILQERWPRALRASTLANLCSTIVGIPLAGVFQHYLQAATIGFTPSLADSSYEPPSKLLDTLFGAAYSFAGDYQDIQLKAVVSLGFAYLLAVLTEYGVFRLALKGNAPAKLKRCAWLVNGATYAPVLALLLSLCAYQALAGTPAEGYYRWLDGLLRAFRLG